MLAEVRGSAAMSRAEGEAQRRVSIGRLPATNRELFGREEELSWLDACWEEGAHVASVVAFGGVGKSALVNRWLAGLRDRGWGGAQRVYGWSFYSQGTDRLGSSDEFVAAALRWFGDPEPEKGSPWDKGERLAELVRRERTLLMLDGLEPLQWGPGVQAGKLKDPALEALVKELGAQNEGLCLITTRIGVADLEGVGGDKVRSKDLGSLSPEAGAELLKARGAKGTDEELQEAVREYKGHGLALTLLGSYLEEVAAGDIQRRKEIGPLEADDAGKPARRVMEAYEKWLGKAEIEILHMIGLFDRPVEEDEIAALRAEPTVPGLTGELVRLGGLGWNKALSKLRKTGLLLVEQDKKLDAHPLVREHFGEQLRREQPEAWREGHRRLYAHLRQKAKPLPETIEEMAPLYAAVVHGCMAGKNQEALDDVYRKRIQRGQAYFNTAKLGAFGSEVTVLSAFFDPPWERLATGIDEWSQGYIFNEAGLDLQALGRLSEAADLMQRSLERNVNRKDWRQAAVGASNFSDLLRSRGRFEEALAQARKGVNFADRGSDAFLSMGLRTTLAAALHAMGRREEATTQFEETERLHKERQPAYPLLYSVQGFQYCDILLDEGRDTEVQERAARTLAWSEAQRFLLDIALDHLSLGRAHLLGAQRGTGGDLAQAASHLTQAVDGIRRASTQHMLPLGLLARAALHTHTRAFDLARRDLDEALSLSTRCGYRPHEADTHLAYVRLSLAESNPTAAHHHLSAAARIIAETGYHRRDAELEAEAKQESTATAQGTSRGTQGAGEEIETINPSLPLAPVAALAVNSGTVPTPPAPSMAMPNLPAFPQPVIDAYRDRKLAILFGSGLSLAKDVTGNFPRWDEIPSRLLDLAEKQRLWTQNQNRRQTRLLQGLPRARRHARGAGQHQGSARGPAGVPGGARRAVPARGRGAGRGASSARRARHRRHPDHQL
ncbi:MAG: hypothetical protein QM820_16560 [Minicystis sp.]